MNIAYDDTIIMGQQIESLEYKYKNFVEEDIVYLLQQMPSHEMNLQDDLFVHFWNRGYPILVKKVRLRESDNALMVVGKSYFNAEKEDEEFFSYMMNFRQIKRIAEQILKFY